MTKAEKVAWLSRYAEAEQEIERLVESIQRWASRAQQVAPQFSHMPRGGGSGGSPQERALDAIAQLQQQLLAAIERQKALQAEIAAAISALPSAGQRQVLRCRYIDGMSLQRAAAASCYSYDRVRHIHSEALAKLQV